MEETDQNMDQNMVNVEEAPVEPPLEGDALEELRGVTRELRSTLEEARNATEALNRLPANILLDDSRALERLEAAASELASKPPVTEDAMERAISDGVEAIAKYCELGGESGDKRDDEIFSRLEERLNELKKDAVSEFERVLGEQREGLMESVDKTRADIKRQLDELGQGQAELAKLARRAGESEDSPQKSVEPASAPGMSERLAGDKLREAVESVISGLGDAFKENSEHFKSISEAIGSLRADVSAGLNNYANYEREMVQWIAGRQAEWQKEFQSRMENGLLSVKKGQIALADTAMEFKAMASREAEEAKEFQNASSEGYIASNKEVLRSMSKMKRELTVVKIMALLSTAMGAAAVAILVLIFMKR
jgi:hypothetical protein